MIISKLKITSEDRVGVRSGEPPGPRFFLRAADPRGDARGLEDVERGTPERDGEVEAFAGA